VIECRVRDAFLADGADILGAGRAVDQVPRYLIPAMGWTCDRSRERRCANGIAAQNGTGQMTPLPLPPLVKSYPWNAKRRRTTLTWQHVPSFDQQVLDTDFSSNSARREAVAAIRLVVIGSDAVAVGIHRSEGVLGIGGSRFGTLLERVGSLWLNLSTFTTAKSD